ncbi:terminase small subunit [Oceanobacillus sp. M60]
MAKLTPKQKSFVEEYLIDLNATQAAIRAGYSKKTAYKTGTENLRKPQIAESIQAAMDERSKRTEITADKVLQELAKIGYSKLTDFVHWNEHGVEILDSEEVDGSVLSEITETINVQVFPNGGESEKRQKKVKLHDKMKALELLGKHLVLFTDKQQVENIAPVFVEDVPEDDD